ncbi:MAG: metal/formaldehyde-sensitive transcriptional repressor [Polyangiales bacterium]
MPHSPSEKKRVLTRVRRIKGQLVALETALEAGADCGPVLQQIAAVRGATNGLMRQVLESHIQETLGVPDVTDAERRQSIDQLNDLLRTYLK